VLVVVILEIAWYFFVRDDAPPPLELSDTTTTEEGTSPAPGTVDTPDGDWVVEVGPAGSEDSSVVGYRVNEKLASLPARSDAVGRTTAVEGTLPIVMADYDIDPPNVAGIVDVDDNGEMEFQLFFVRA